MDLILHLSLYIYNVSGKRCIMHILFVQLVYPVNNLSNSFPHTGSKLLSIFISQGFSKGLNLREYAFDNIQISADGIMSSDYVDEFEPSLTLNVNQTLRMHAGSRIEVSLK